MNRLEEMRRRHTGMHGHAWAAFFICVSCAAQSQLTITSVVDGADFRPGFPQKGSLAAIFVTGLTGENGTIFNPQNPLTNSFHGIETWVNFDPAPIVSVSFQNGFEQINVQIPWEGQRDPLYLEVFQGANRATFEGPYTNAGFNLGATWSVWFVDATGHAIVQHSADYSLVTPQNPAQVGEYLVAYGINLGPVTNTPSTGEATPANPQSVFNPTALGQGVCGAYDTIMLGTAPAIPTYDGLAPGLVGVYQINFQVPKTPPGEVPLAVQRTVIQFPFGACQPDQQHLTTTTLSFPASLSIR